MSRDLDRETCLRVTIIAAEAKAAIARTDGGLAEKVKAAMRAALKNWLRTPEEERFIGAVTGAMTFFGEGSTEYEKLKKEMLALRKISDALAAAQSGVAIDWAATLPEKDETFIGLRKLWDEVKSEARIR